MNAKLTGKFINFLKTFSKEEIKAFEKWLNAPFSDANKNLPKLFEKIKKYHPNYDHRLLTKERVFKHVFPGKKYSADWLNNLLSKAYFQAENFLICQNALQNKNLRANLLANEFQTRHLEDSFFKLTDREEARLEEKDIKDWEDHLELLRLNRRVYHHPNQNPRMKADSSTIVKMNENLTLVYLLEKAMIINEMIFRNRILKNENHDIAKELAIWRVAAEGVDDLAIKLYRKRFGYTEENMVEEYFEMRKMFFEGCEKLNYIDQKIHFLSLANDSNFLKKRGKIEGKEVLFVYKKGLQTGILPIENQLSRITFATIIIYSNVEKDFSFSENFVQNYIKFLPFEIQEDAKNWALAHIAYRKEELEKSIQILLENEFKTFHFQKISKMLNLQAYFDLFLIDESYSNYVIDFANATEKWILRDKRFSKHNKSSYLRFVQNLKFLVKAYLNKDFKNKKLKTFISDEKNIQGRNWLLSKRNEILARKKGVTEIKQ